MAEGLAFTVPILTVSGDEEDLSESMVHNQSSQMLADALKRMDGLIGDYRYPPRKLNYAKVTKIRYVINCVLDSQVVQELAS